MIVREATWARLIDALKDYGADNEGLLDVMAKIGEKLNMSEAMHMECFLVWCQQNNKWFGSRNYKDRWNEFVADGGLVKNLKIPQKTQAEREQEAQDKNILNHIEVGATDIMLHKFDCYMKNTTVIAWDGDKKILTLQL